MSLYYDAAAILSTSPSAGGSLKSRIYNNESLRSSPPQIYALISETSKWDVLLKEVIENAGILPLEPKLSPLVALLLIHDHLLSKRGIAAPVNHPLRQAVERHKARLQAEFTKARLRRRCASIEQLRLHVQKQKQAENGCSTSHWHPRWVRINTFYNSLERHLSTTFASYAQTASLSDLQAALLAQKLMCIDRHIPNLVGLPADSDVTKTPAYKSGQLILQDKASCFPAQLLIGSAASSKGRNGGWKGGDIIDACAAPGNKTTHLASLASRICEASQGSNPIPTPKIFACERDRARSKTLQCMVSLTKANTLVTVLSNTDFLTLDPTDPRFGNATALLLDPSCSGSGIVGREDVPELTLPSVPMKATTSSSATTNQSSKGKRKRKHAPSEPSTAPSPSKSPRPPPATYHEAESDILENGETLPTFTSARDLQTRLAALSTLQFRLLTHAFSFPAATRVTYSTCSIHMAENEGVVARALRSAVARERGWRVLKREEQVEGLRRWGIRGVKELAAGQEAEDGHGREELEWGDEESEACIRCAVGATGDEQGTMGFFAVGFVREEDPPTDERPSATVKPDDAAAAATAGGDKHLDEDGEEEKEEEAEEWNGFSSDQD